LQADESADENWIWCDIPAQKADSCRTSGAGMDRHPDAVGEGSADYEKGERNCRIKNAYTSWN